MNFSPPGFSVHGILQAIILEWVAVSFSRGSSQPRDWSCTSIIVRWIYHWATSEAPYFVIRMNKILVSSSQIRYIYTAGLNYYPFDSLQLGRNMTQCQSYSQPYLRSDVWDLLLCRFPDSSSGNSESLDLRYKSSNFKFLQASTGKSAVCWVCLEKPWGV